MTTVYLDDLRTAGIGTCPVARELLAGYGVDWKKLSRRGGGYAVEELQHIDDPRLARVIEAAEKREAADGRG